MVIFDAQAQVIHTEQIGARGEIWGIELPEATWIQTWEQLFTGTQ